MRREMNRRLGQAGRQLITVTKPASGSAEPTSTYITGWDDDTAGELLSRGHQALSAVDLAVLALVLLHSVVIPQAAGDLPPHGFSTGVSVDAATLRHRGSDGRGVSADDIDAALSRLRARTLITSDNRPGSAFVRLSERQQARLWRNLLTFARPSWARSNPDHDDAIAAHQTTEDDHL